MSEAHIGLAKRRLLRAGSPCTMGDMSRPQAPSALEPSRIPLRVLVIPGLNDSGPGHWQTWLQDQYHGSVRVAQDHWDRPDLQAWSDRIARTLARHDPRTEWVAVAHSFGCLALAHHLGLSRAMADEGRLAASGWPRVGFGRIRAALMVAPASPDKFGVRHLLPSQGLGLPATMVASDTDPWMSAREAHDWADRWGTRFTNLGDAGHINVESGHGPWLLARYKVDEMIRYLQRTRRLELAHPLEFHYAV